eukprot:3620249-Amphidinium_carterae.1
MQQRVKLCLKEGHCVCKGIGRKVRSIFVQLQRLWRHVASTDASLEQRMCAGECLLHWQGRVPMDGPSASADVVEENHFSYVALAHKRPWKMVTMRLVTPEIDFPAMPWTSEQRQGLGYVEFPLQQPVTVENLYVFVEECLDLRKEWKVQLWLLSERARPVATASIAGLCMASAVDLDARLVWSPRA